MISPRLSSGDSSRIFRRLANRELWIGKDHLGDVVATIIDAAAHVMLALAHLFRTHKAGGRKPQHRRSADNGANTDSAKKLPMLPDVVSILWNREVSAPICVQFPEHRDSSFALNCRFMLSTSTGLFLISLAAIRLALRIVASRRRASSSSFAAVLRNCLLISIGSLSWRFS